MSTTSVMHVLNLGCFWSLDIPYTYIEYILNHIGAADTHFYALGKGHRCLLHFNESISSLPMDDVTSQKVRAFTI